MPKVKLEKTINCRFYSPLRYDNSGDQNIHRQSIENSGIVLNTALNNVGTTSDNSNVSSSSTTTPQPNVGFSVVQQVKKGNFVNSKTFKAVVLEPVIEGLCQ